MIYESPQGNVRAVVRSDHSSPNPRNAEETLSTIIVFGIEHISPDPSNQWDDWAAQRAMAKRATLLNSPSWVARHRDDNGPYRWDYYTPSRWALVRAMRVSGKYVVVVPLQVLETGRLYIPEEVTLPGAIVGFAYIETEKWLEAGGDEYSEMLAERIIEDELEEWNAWASGDVWRIDLQSVSVCPCEGSHPGCDGEVWETDDAYTGIYGSDQACALAAEVVGFPAIQSDPAA